MVATPASRMKPALIADVKIAGSILFLRRGQYRRCLPGLAVWALVPRHPELGAAS